MDEKKVPIPEKGTAQPCQWGINVDHEQSLGNCVRDGIDIYIYIYIYYDGSQYKDIFLLHEIFNDKYWWVTSYEIAIRIIYLKVCSHTPMLVNSTYWVILLPSISPYRYIRGIIGVEIFRRQQLRIILWNWGFYYYFYGIKYCIGELFWGCFEFGELELWLLWWDSRLLVSFI